MPDTLFWICLPPSAAEFAGDGEPRVGQERGDAVMGAAEDRLLETVAAAEHQRVGVRVQIGDDPGRRGNACRGAALVVDVHRLEEASGRRRRQVHQRGVAARHDVRRAAFAGEGDAGDAARSAESIVAASHARCRGRRFDLVASPCCEFSGRNPLATDVQPARRGVPLYEPADDVAMRRATKFVHPMHADAVDAVCHCETGSGLFGRDCIRRDARKRCRLRSYRCIPRIRASEIPRSRVATCRKPLDCAQQPHVLQCRKRTYR